MRVANGEDLKTLTTMKPLPTKLVLSSVQVEDAYIPYIMHTNLQKLLVAVHCTVESEENFFKALLRLKNLRHLRIWGLSEYLNCFKGLHRSLLSDTLVRVYFDKISFSTAATLRAGKQFLHFKALRIIGVERADTRRERELKEASNLRLRCSFMYNIHAIPQLSRVLIIGADSSLMDFHVTLIQRLFARERNIRRQIDRVLLGNIGHKTDIQRVLGPACREARSIDFVFHWFGGLERLFNKDELSFLRMSSVAGNIESTVFLWDRLWAP